MSWRNNRKPKRRTTERKAAEFLLGQANQFARHLGEYRKKETEKDCSYHFHTAISSCEIILNWERRSKLFSKLYHLTITSIINSPTITRCYNTKLKFAGLTSQTAYFANNGKTEGFAYELNENDELVKLVNDLIRKVHLDRMTIVFNNDEKRWEVSITPYAGSIVFLFLPPITYPVKFIDNEIEILSKFVMDIGRLLKNYQKSFP